MTRFEYPRSTQSWLLASRIYHLVADIRRGLNRQLRWATEMQRLLPVSRHDGTHAVGCSLVIDLPMLFMVDMPSGVRGAETVLDDLSLEVIGAIALQLCLSTETPSMKH